MMKNMQTKQVLSLVNLKEDKYDFLRKLFENSYIDEITGHIYCKRCKTLDHINWSRDLAFCKMHIISGSEVNLKKNEKYEISV